MLVLFCEFGFLSSFVVLWIHRVNLVLNNLEELKDRVAEYSSQLPRKLRKTSLHRFRTKAIDVLIASDAMGRGMDIEDIDNVVNYDTPGHVKTYIHRYVVEGWFYWNQSWSSQWKCLQCALS